jgi:hypothetical protein
MNTASVWHCPVCKGEVETAFCPSCGERELHPRDLTLRSLLMQVFTALTSVDGRVLRSFRILLLQPGALTIAFLQGKRRPYIAALPLFLLANVLFFAIQSVSPEKIFSSPLRSHLHQQDWQALAQTLVARKLAADGTTESAYAPIFDRAVALNAKSLVILMAAPLLLLLPALFRRSARPFAAHVVFALHSYAFQLVMLCALLVVATIASWVQERAATSMLLDHLLFGVYLLGCCSYFFIASGVAYGAAGVTRWLQAATLTLAAAVTVIGYRFALFLITLYAT